MILVYTMGVLHMLDRVVWQESILDIVVWVQTQMSAICPRSDQK